MDVHYDLSIFSNNAEEIKVHRSAYKEENKCTLKNTCFSSNTKHLLNTYTLETHNCGF
jgi:hypothetical protein